MITVTYQSNNYRPDDVRCRYVRYSLQGEYLWCEVGENKQYDLRQGTVPENELPLALQEAARKQARSFPSYVEWPFVEVLPLNRTAKREKIKC